MKQPHCGKHFFVHATRPGVAEKLQHGLECIGWVEVENTLLCSTTKYHKMRTIRRYHKIPQKPHTLWWKACLVGLYDTQVRCCSMLHLRQAGRGLCASQSQVAMATCHKITSLRIIEPHLLQ